MGGGGYMERLKRKRQKTQNDQEKHNLVTPSMVLGAPTLELSPLCLGTSEYGHPSPIHKPM